MLSWYFVGIKREKKREGERERERERKREIAINTEGSANISIMPLDTKYRGYDVILFSEVLHSSLFSVNIG